MDPKRQAQATSGQATAGNGRGVVLSVVVPLRNEQANLDPFFGRLLPVLERLGLPAEVVCVDDGSDDRSWAVLLEWRAREPMIKALSLSRNFGKEVALTAGLDTASGEAVVLIDADLQHPPELIPALVHKWRAGFEMVYAARRSRSTDSPLRRLAARAFYRLFRALSDVEMPDGAGDFRLLDRRVVEALKRMPERARFMKGMYAWVGFRHTGVPYDPELRMGGASAFTLPRLVRFACDGMISFSTKPLTACAWLGAVIAVASMLTGLYFMLRTLVSGADVPGWATIVVAIMLLGGVQLLSLGVLGAYLGRLYEESKRRPLYIVRDSEGVAERSAAMLRPLHPAVGVPIMEHAPDAEPEAIPAAASTTAAE